MLLLVVHMNFALSFMPACNEDFGSTEIEVIFDEGSIQKGRVDVYIFTRMTIKLENGEKIKVGTKEMK